MNDGSFISGVLAWFNVVGWGQGAAVSGIAGKGGLALVVGMLKKTGLMVRHSPYAAIRTVVCMYSAHTMSLWNNKLLTNTATNALELVSCMSCLPWALCTTAYLQTFGRIL